MRILIVDDQKHICGILSRVLSNAGFTVKTAQTVKEALSIADKGRISAAIIDFRLPDGNGLSLFSKFRERHRDFPCVFITSYGSNKLRQDSLKLGFTACLEKPFDNDALLAALNKALGIAET
jgi:DNA-binding NtrC family response regulator